MENEVGKKIMDKMRFDYILRALWLHHALTITAICEWDFVFSFPFAILGGSDSVNVRTADNRNFCLTEMSHTNSKSMRFNGLCLA